MNPCTVTTGFFVLGRCGNPSVTACGQCGRPVCARHAGPSGLCPECANQQGFADDPYQPGWARGYRRRFYQHSSRMYSDAYWYSTFDSYDRGAFDDGFDVVDYGGDGSDGWVDS